MRKLYLVALLPLVLVFVGCSNKIEPKPNKIINDVSKLKQSPLSKNTFYYIKKGSDFSKYNHIIVPKMNTYIQDDENKQIKNNKLLEEVSNYFTTNLQKQLQEVVENSEETENSLIFNASIISLDLGYEDLEFYQFLPYSLAFTAIKRTSGIEKRKLKLNFALKVIDKNSKETIAAILEHNIKETELDNIDKLTLDDLKPVLNKWIQKYKLRLKELKENKYRF